MPDPGIVRSVGGIVFDVTVSESQTDKLEATEHPVQAGSPVSDHAYMLPREVTLIVGKGAAEGDEVPKETYDKIKELQSSREPFDIITGKDEYHNMLLTGLSMTTDMTTEAVLLATLECREVILVEAQAVAVSGKGPTSKQSAGERTQTTQQGGSKQAQAQGGEPGNKAKAKTGLKSLIG